MLPSSKVGSIANCKSTQSVKLFLLYLEQNAKCRMYHVKTVFDPIVYIEYIIVLLFFLSVSKLVEGNDLSQARSAEPKEKCKKETRIPETTLSRL
ncbi:MAG: hypothetical protein ACI90V_013199, partial [Bacillariaceae sp.]